MKTVIKLSMLVLIMLVSGAKTNSCSLSQSSVQPKSLQGIAEKKIIEINTWSLTTRFDF